MRCSDEYYHQFTKKGDYEENEWKEGGGANDEGDDFDDGDE